MSVSGIRIIPLTIIPLTFRSAAGRKRDVGFAFTRWRRGLAAAFAATRLNRSGLNLQFSPRSVTFRDAAGLSFIDIAGANVQEL